MNSLALFGVSFPLIPFLGLSALLLMAIGNRLLPFGVPGLIDRIISRVFVAMIVSRMVFVVQYRDQYFSDETPAFAIVDIRDRGFEPVAFLVVMALGLGHMLLREPRLRRPLLVLMATALVWVGAGMTLFKYSYSTPQNWPEYSFRDLTGNPEPLRSGVANMTVVNLWATWCPSCRTEMPVFEQAQYSYPHVRFIMLNQGESMTEVADFIEAEGYQFDNLWLDTEGRMGLWFGQSALPVTLVFNKEGKLLSGHMGVMSAAVLEQLLTQGSGLSLPSHF